LASPGRTPNAPIAAKLSDVDLMKPRRVTDGI
jgi:hypothetical protein